MADAADLGSVAVRREGSSPSPCTKTMRRPLATLLLIALAACHRSEVVERVPAAPGLARHAPLALVLHRVDPRANDEVMSALEEALRDRLSGPFEVKDRGTLALHVTLVSLGEDGRRVTLGVDLVDASTQASLGRFEVIAQPDAEPPSMGGSLDVRTESATDKALAAAARELANYLEEHR